MMHYPPLLLPPSRLPALPAGIDDPYEEPLNPEITVQAFDQREPWASSPAPPGQHASCRLLALETTRVRLGPFLGQPGS